MPESMDEIFSGPISRINPSEGATVRGAMFAVDQVITEFYPALNIQQAYSIWRYMHPEAVHAGLFVRKGCPKSQDRPGSSTDVLIFEPGKIDFTPDLIANSKRCGVLSLYIADSSRPLIETDIKVRSPLARRRGGET